MVRLESRSAWLYGGSGAAVVNILRTGYRLQHEGPWRALTRQKHTR